MAILESNIVNILKRIDDKGAHQVNSEYNSIDNSFKYSHHGLGYLVKSSETSNENYITISNGTANCTCSTFSQYKLPCKHLLFIMKSVIDLEPFLDVKWLKKSLLSKVSNEDYSESIETQSHNSNESNKFTIQTQTARHNELKLVFDQITNLLCLIGQEEFNHNLTFYKQHLVALQVNNKIQALESVPTTSNYNQQQEIDNDDEIEQDYFDQRDADDEYLSNESENDQDYDNLFRVEKAFRENKRKPNQDTSEISESSSPRKHLKLDSDDNEDDLVINF